MILIFWMSTSSRMISPFLSNFLDTSIGSPFILLYKYPDSRLAFTVAVILSSSSDHNGIPNVFPNKCTLPAWLSTMIVLSYVYVLSPTMISCVLSLGVMMSPIFIFLISIFPVPFPQDLSPSRPHMSITPTNTTVPFPPMRLNMSLNI